MQDPSQPSILTINDRLAFFFNGILLDKRFIVAEDLYESTRQLSMMIFAHSGQCFYDCQIVWQ